MLIKDLDNVFVPYLQKLKIQFRKNCLFLWTAFSFLLIEPVLSCLSSANWLELAISSSFCYLLSCLLGLILSVASDARVLLAPLLLMVFASFDLLAIVCFAQFGTPVDITTIQTMMDTNWNEIIEFLTLFVPAWSVLSFSLLLAAIIFFDYVCWQKKWMMGQVQFSIHLHAIIFISIVLSICYRHVYTTFQNLDGWTIPFENIAINLADYEPSSMNLTESSSHHPTLVILVIGESHSRAHSSLYGYPRSTNPRLEALVRDSSIVVFMDAVSPATVTVKSFQYILNTRHLSDAAEPWYHFPSVITAMKSAGYKTVWYSNQDEVGLFDNMASCYAHICDSYTFNTDVERLDESLVRFHSVKGNKEFVIYHLMGQHVDFAKRYPHEGFSRFVEDDYNSLDPELRPIAAHYDNACLYNDAVVSDLMLKYKDEDAVVMYFPDHGLDVFQSSPNYAGHARRLNKESVRIGSEIPFVVFFSDSFRKQNPALVSTIKTRADLPFCTDDITNFVLEVTGYNLQNPIANEN